MTSQNDTQVLIVGAGVVGLAASLFLSQHGIKTTVIERRAGTSIHPRSRSVNQRATELFRHLGIEKAVLDAGKEIATSKGMYKGASVREAIEPHQRKEGGSKNPAAQAAGLFGPTKGSFVTQDYLEPLFLETAEQQNVTVRFSTEFQSMTQDHNGVKTTVKNRKTGDISTISSDYVIAADGARSPVCQALNVKKGGRGVVGHMINILFKADMAAFVKNREFSQVRIRGKNVQGLFCAINNSDRWVFHLSYDPARGEKASDFNKENCVDLVRQASGMPDLKVEIESLLPWEAAVTYAEQMRHGRVFIAGDAAHQMPPWAGQGANSGYADVHNLAWKIAAVLKGQAGDALLDTYSVERQPVGKNAAETSAGGIDERGFADLNLKSLTVLRAFARKGSLINGLGYCYDSAAICYEDTWPLNGWTWKPATMAAVFFDLDGRPGRRVPHLWVERDLKRISTIDLIEHSFTLLTADSGEKWKEVASWVQKELGVQIHVHSIGPKGDMIAKAGEWTTAAGIASNGALLVRPDDFVAARWRRTPADATAELRRALLQVLQRNA